MVLRLALLWETQAVYTLHLTSVQVTSLRDINKPPPERRKLRRPKGQFGLRSVSGRASPPDRAIPTPRAWSN